METLSPDQPTLDVHSAHRSTTGLSRKLHNRSPQTAVEVAEEDISGALAALATAVAPASATPPSLATLAGCASDQLQLIQRKLETSTASVADCAEAFTALYTPLAFVHGAFSLARDADEAVLMHLLVDAHCLMRDAQVSLRCAALTQGLQAPAAPIASAGVQGAPSITELRRLAARANHEIEKLAESLQAQATHIAGEEHPIVHGIASRIMLLTEIVFYAGALYDGTAEECGVPPIETLQRRFSGRLDA